MCSAISSPEIERHTTLRRRPFRTCPSLYRAFRPAAKRAAAPDVFLFSYAWRLEGLRLRPDRRNDSAVLPAAADRRPGPGHCGRRRLSGSDRGDPRRVRFRQEPDRPVRPDHAAAASGRLRQVADRWKPGSGQGAGLPARHPVPGRNGAESEPADLPAAGRLAGAEAHRGGASCGARRADGDAGISRFRHRPAVDQPVRRRARMAALDRLRRTGDLGAAGDLGRLLPGPQADPRGRGQHSCRPGRRLRAHRPLDRGVRKPDPVAPCSAQRPAGRPARGLHHETQPVPRHCRRRRGGPVLPRRHDLRRRPVRPRSPRHRSVDAPGRPAGAGSSIGNGRTGARRAGASAERHALVGRIGPVRYPDRLQHRHDLRPGGGAQGRLAGRRPEAADHLHPVVSVLRHGGDGDRPAGRQRLLGGHADARPGDLAGLLPPEHGARNRAGYPQAEAGDRRRPPRPDPQPRPDDPPRRDRRPRRPVGVGQDPDLLRSRRPGSAGRARRGRRDSSGRPPHRQSGRGGMARRARRSHRHGVPGPPVLVQPGEDGGLHSDRVGATPSRPRQGRRPRPGRRNPTRHAPAGRRRLRRRLPAPVVGRATPTRHDRPGADQSARADPGRRADHGAGPDGPVADSGPVAASGPAGRRPDDHPRHRRRRRRLRPYRRHAGRRDRRGRPHGAGAVRAPASLHPQPAGRRPPGETDMTAPLLSIQNLGVAYGSGRDRRFVLRGAGFDLEPGQVMAIVGESGSGKRRPVASGQTLQDHAARHPDGLSGPRRQSESAPVDPHRAGRTADRGGQAGRRGATAAGRRTNGPRSSGPSPAGPAALRPVRRAETARRHRPRPVHGAAPADRRRGAFGPGLRQSGQGLRPTAGAEGSAESGHAVRLARHAQRAPHGRPRLRHRRRSGRRTGAGRRGPLPPQERLYAVVAGRRPQPGRRPGRPAPERRPGSRRADLGRGAGGRDGHHRRERPHAGAVPLMTPKRLRLFIAACLGAVLVAACGQGGASQPTPATGSQVLRPSRLPAVAGHLRRPDRHRRQRPAGAGPGDRMDAGRTDGLALQAARRRALLQRSPVRRRGCGRGLRLPALGSGQAQPDRLRSPRHRRSARRRAAGAGDPHRTARSGPAAPPGRHHDDRAEGPGRYGHGRLRPEAGRHRRLRHDRLGPAHPPPDPGPKPEVVAPRGGADTGPAVGRCGPVAGRPGGDGAAGAQRLPRPLHPRHAGEGLLLPQCGRRSGLAPARRSRASGAQLRRRQGGDRLPAAGKRQAVRPACGQGGVRL
uniref:ABC transporter domain-containing protein n=1 Tax=Parastrongyloides trichosuri TaxID=131310 RepID=A0A0N4Z3S4_PARTI